MNRVGERCSIAAKELWRACCALAGRYARHSGPVVERDDLAQEGLVAGWQRLAQGSSLTHAILAARTAMIDHLRKHGPYGRRESAEGGYYHRGVTPVDMQLLSELVHDETDDVTAVDNEIAVSQLLEVLSEREAAVIIRHDLIGDRLWEIGEDLGVTESRVSQIRLRALRRIREHLHERGHHTHERP